MSLSARARRASRCPGCGLIAQEFQQVAWSDDDGEHTADCCAACVAAALTVIGEVE